MNLKFEIKPVEALIEHTRKLISDEVPLRDGNDEPGLILASQYGARVYLMSSMKGSEWTSRIVFAENCNPDADDFNDEFAFAAYGTEETVELIPLDKLECCVATAKESGREYLTVTRYAGCSSSF